jgi:beta-1,4-mannosyl-glycoprotein beta-1,4-N-acetylglucosaminyltransferase
MKIFDTITFFNELDLLELRLNILNDVVDYFVINEANITFTGSADCPPPSP